MRTNKSITRRLTIAGMIGTAGVYAFPVVALSKSDAEKLIENLTIDVLSAVNEKKSDKIMFGKFEIIFSKYADVPLIARKALGPKWREASKAQRSAYVSAFKGYMARYYGKRFEVFLGSKIVVSNSRKTSGGFLVGCNIILKNGSSYQAQWHVIDARGKFLMYNLFLEGVSVLSDVRLQIGSMLDKRGGSIEKLTSHLNTAS
ncbi:ABC transporter substrate-binding protein [Amylibacter sp.]|nr:ABC transporter substrate-binding protein [Amylibacter sp.]MDB4248668.1 ABC transporter substrate-binding protein [Amylibacter sp.]MDB4251171.1 ABC transporter substrate-binding protein [Amylibacter sp.]